MAARSKSLDKRRARKPTTWKDIDQSVKPKAMSPASERRVWMGRAKVAAMGLACVGVVVAALQLAAFVDAGPELLTKAGESMPIESIEVSTDGNLQREFLIETMGVDSDANLLGVDLDLLKERLESLGQVSSAVVARRFPDALVVSVAERHPIARILAQRSNGEKLLLFVDASGHVFEAQSLDTSVARTLPFLAGIALRREDEGFAAIEGIDALAALLSEASAIAPHLYRRWQVVSLEQEGRIIAKGPLAKEVVFDAASDFRAQLGKLDYIIDYYRGARAEGVGRVDLTLGGQVPVKPL